MDGHENGERTMRQRRTKVGAPATGKRGKPTHEVVASYLDGSEKVLRRCYSEKSALRFRAERIRAAIFHRSAGRPPGLGPVYIVRPVGEP